MSAPKYSAEFTEQVVPRDHSTIPSGGRGREVLRVGPADRGQLGREMAHRASRARGGEFVDRGERRDQTIEGRAPRGPHGSRAPRRKRRPSSLRSPSEHQVRIHPQRRRQLSRPVHVSVGESIQVRLLRLARPARLSNSQEKTGPDRHHRPVLR